MDPRYKVIREDLIRSALKRWPDLERGAVCACGAVMRAESAPGHVGGSNKAWTVKARFKAKHKIIGYTVIGREGEGE